MEKFWRSEGNRLLKNQKADVKYKRTLVTDKII